MDPAALPLAFAGGGGPEAAGAQDFLRRIGWLAGAPPRPAGSPAEAAARGRLLAVARAAEALFLLRHGGGPGVTLIGARGLPARLGLGDGGRGPVPAGGAGLDPGAALAACLGELAERMLVRAFRPRPAAPDALPAGTLHPGLAGAPGDGTPPLAAEAAETGAAVALPAGWALPRLAGTAGVAAGPDREGAARRAILELRERHAVALWWFGGRPAAAPGPEAAAALARVFGGGPGGRRRWMLDLTVPPGPPVRAALSTGPDGQGLVLGAAADDGAEAAALRAALELCQMEAGAALALARAAARGAEALAPGERLWLDRHVLLRPEDLPQLRPAAAGPLPPAGAEGEGPVWLLDLADPGLPVACLRALAPGLATMADGAAHPAVLAEAARSGTDPARRAALPAPL